MVNTCFIHHAFTIFWGIHHCLLPATAPVASRCCPGSFPQLPLQLPAISEFPRAKLRVSLDETLSFKG